MTSMIVSNLTTQEDILAQVIDAKIVFTVGVHEKAELVELFFETYTKSTYICWRI